MEVGSGPQDLSRVVASTASIGGADIPGPLLTRAQSRTVPGPLLTLTQSWMVQQVPLGSPWWRKAACAVWLVSRPQRVWRASSVGTEPISPCFQVASQLRFFDPQLKEKPEEEASAEPAWLVQLQLVERRVEVRWV